ncbi:MAG TPA: winged helix-turn-helix domain-containing protein [Terriglobales bacterium]|jgi:TolB-like protein/DNA-binding winged helix-turn-helix (wHTH) protein|nr:winged helix-turn-helix domain-containing protein [Terriglobales bacterium]
MAAPLQSPVPGQRVLRFAVFEADLRTFELRKFGTKISIQRQPFQVLATLLEKPGQVVTRQELQGKIWPGDTFVDFDLGLNKAIAKLRAILNDDPASPRFIETLPRVGYRFLAAVVGAPPDAPVEKAILPAKQGLPAIADKTVATPAPESLSSKPQSGRRWTIYAASLLALLVAVLALYPTLHERWAQWRDVGHPFNSIAVLPLQNLSGDSGQDYFADGVTEELTTDLAKVPDLRVSSRTSVMRYKDARESLPDIAKDLKVEAIVEGSVTRIGNKVRITAQLIDARKDQHLWAESFDSEVKDILSVQDNLARAIAQKVRINLTPEQAQQLVARTHVPPPEAYEAYLKGRYFFFQWNPESFKKSCDFFEQTIQIDAEYADAYAGMADCYTALASVGISPPDVAMPKAKSMAEKALEIDASLAHAHGVLGTILLNYDWDWPAAHNELQKALELSPNDPDAHLRILSYYRAVGDIDAAAREAKAAMALDPVSARVASSLAWLYLFSGQYDLAEPAMKKCLELDPNFLYAHDGLVIVYEHKKDYARAIEERREMLALSRENDAADTLMKIYKSSGYEEARTYDIKHGIETEQSPFLIAAGYASLGDKEKTLEYLQKAYDQRSSMMIQLKVNCYFDFVRPDPRFKELLKKLRLADAS